MKRNVRDHAKNKLLESMDTFLKDNKKIDFDQYKEFSLIQDILSQINRARREFEATLFFVVVFGPLKAGKSTMVNLLSREYVSPTKPGTECTMRPSIILQSEETGIDEYFTITLNDDKDNAFHKIIDYLRGIMNEEELQQYVRKETTKLTKRNIEKKLTEPLDMEPLITVIRVPGGNLVKKGIALLDMPGLDGAKTNWHNSPVHKWVINRSDFLIFIQSSIAALNNDTVEFLEKVVVESRNPQLWLVQNIMNIKHWRDEQERRQEAIQQEQEAKKMIMDRLNIQNDLPTTKINLGMADDGIFHEKENLLKESGFEDFEKKLHKILDQGRIAIQEANCINGVQKTLIRVKGLIEDGIMRLEGFKKNYNETISNIEKCIHKVNQIDYDSKLHMNNLVSEVLALLEVEKNEWLQSVEQITNIYKEKLTPIINAKELNLNFKQCIEEIAVTDKDIHFDIFGIYGTEIKEKVDKATKGSEDQIISEVNQILSESGIQKIIDFHNFKTHMIPKIDLSELEPFKYEEKFLILFPKKYKEPQIKDGFNNLKSYVKEHFGAIKNDWLKSFKLVYLNEFCEERKRCMRLFLEDEKSKYKQKMSRQIEKCDNTLLLLRKMDRDIYNLTCLVQENL